MPSTLWGINTIYLIIAAEAVLLLLVIIVTSSGRRKRAEQAAQTAVAALAEHVSAPGRLNAKTVAAIMAAVSAASGMPVSQLRFAAIRRVSGMQGPWASSGTAEIIASRQTYL